MGTSSDVGVRGGVGKMVVGVLALHSSHTHLLGGDGDRGSDGGPIPTVSYN